MIKCCIPVTLFQAWGEALLCRIDNCRCRTSRAAEPLQCCVYPLSIHMLPPWLKVGNGLTNNIKILTHQSSVSVLLHHAFWWCTTRPRRRTETGSWRQRSEASAGGRHLTIHPPVDLRGLNEAIMTMAPSRGQVSHLSVSLWWSDGGSQNFRFACMVCQACTSISVTHVIYIKANLSVLAKHSPDGGKLRCPLEIIIWYSHIDRH